MSCDSSVPQITLCVDLAPDLTPMHSNYVRQKKNKKKNKSDVFHLRIDRINTIRTKSHKQVESNNYNLETSCLPESLLRQKFATMEGGTS